MAERTTTNASNSLDADLAALREDLKSLASTVSELSKSKSEDIKQQFGASVDKAVERGRDAADSFQETVKQRPVTSVLMALGVGMVIGHLLDRR